MPQPGGLAAGAGAGPAAGRRRRPASWRIAGGAAIGVVPTCGAKCQVLGCYYGDASPARSEGSIHA